MDKELDAVVDNELLADVELSVNEVDTELE